MTKVQSRPKQEERHCDALPSDAEKLARQGKKTGKRLIFIKYYFLLLNTAAAVYPVNATTIMFQSFRSSRKTRWAAKGRCLLCPSIAAPVFAGAHRHEDIQ
jgi:hypothetical protein